MKFLPLLLFFSVGAVAGDEPRYVYTQEEIESLSTFVFGVHKYAPNYERDYQSTLAEPVYVDVLEVNHHPHPWASYLEAATTFTLNRDANRDHYPAMLGDEYLAGGKTTVRKTARGWECQLMGRTVIAKRFFETRTKFNRAEAFQDAALVRDIDRSRKAGLYQ